MTFYADIRHAFRSLARNPGFTIVVALTLALGIGGTTAVFSLLRVSLLSRLPYPDADRIVALDLVQTNGDAFMESWSFPKYETMRQHVTTLELVATRRGAEVILAGGSEPVRAYQEAATPSYFTLFGTRAELGRLFIAADDVPGAAPVAVLPHEEGCGRRGDGDQGRFFQIALGSASELEYQTLLSHDLGFLSNDQYDFVSEMVVDVKRMLSGLTRPRMADGGWRKAGRGRQTP